MCVDVGLVTCGPSNPCAFILSHLRNTLVIQGLIVLVEVLGRIMEACEGLRTHRGGGSTDPPMWAHSLQFSSFLHLHSNKDMYMWNQVICIKFITTLHISIQKRYFVDSFDYAKL
jgi:hypothetical protein